MSATNTEQDDRAERYSWNGMNFDDFEVTEGDGEELEFEEKSEEAPKQEAQDENPDIERRVTLPFGLIAYIENEAGSVRRGPWGSVIIRNPYGYISGTGGVDGDAVDCFLGEEYETAPIVYVIHQGAPDPEDKLMIGFSSAKAAAEAYERNYDAPPEYTMSKVYTHDLPTKLIKLNGRRLQ